MIGTFGPTDEASFIIILHRNDSSSALKILHFIKTNEYTETMFIIM